jgi:Predicted nucleotidyltransferases
MMCLTRNHYRSFPQYTGMNRANSSSKLSFEDLCELVSPIALKHGVIRMYLFGSRARGDDNDRSDYDFCLDVPKEYDLIDIGSILSDLEEVLGSEVDIICEDNLREGSYITEEILRDRRVVFEA